VSFEDDNSGYEWGDIDKIHRVGLSVGVSVLSC